MEISGRTLAIGIAVLGVGGAVWLVWPRHPPSDEERIREAIEAMARGAEDRDVSAIAEHVSESYRGEAGTKDELKGLLFHFLHGADFVSVVLRGVHVDVQGDQADVVLRVVLARVKGAPEVKESDVVNAGAHEIKAHFVREKDEWRVSQAAQREITPGQALLP